LFILSYNFLYNYFKINSILSHNAKDGTDRLVRIGNSGLPCHGVHGCKKRIVSSSRRTQKWICFVMTTVTFNLLVSTALLFLCLCAHEEAANGSLFVEKRNDPRPYTARDNSRTRLLRRHVPLPRSFLILANLRRWSPRYHKLSLPFSLLLVIGDY